MALILSANISYGNIDSVNLWMTLSKSKDKKISIEHYYKLGEWYARAGSKFDSAIIFLETAKVEYERTNNKRQIGNCNYLMGIAHARMGEVKTALNEFSTAEKYFIEIKDTSKMIFALEAKGFAFNSKERIDLFNKTLALARQANLIQNEITILGNLSRAYSNTGLLDSSINILNRQYQILINRKLTTEEAARENNTRLTYCTQSLGHTYYQKKDFRKSFEYFIKAYRIGKKVDPNFSELTMIIGQIGLVSHYWGKTNPAARNKAFKNLNLLNLLREGQKIATSSKSFNPKTRIVESFIAYFEDQKSYDSIIHYQKILIGLKDSAKRDEQIKASAKFAEELKTADKEKEIIKLNADKKIASATANRNKIIFILVLVGLLSSIYFIIKRIKYQNLKEQEERDKNFRTKLSSDLHDDVGTILTSLSMQSELLELKTTDGNKGTVGKIANMSREATRRMRDTVWAIDSRKDNVMDLAYRMIDFADDMLGAKEIEFQLEHNIEGKEDKISAELRQTIFLIFKEAITNAAKYCSGEMVTASLLKGKDTLQLKVQNDTNHKINIDEVSGLGLSNIKKRVADIGGELNLKQDNATFILELSFVI